MLKLMYKNFSGGKHQLSCVWSLDIAA